MAITNAYLKSNLGKQRDNVEERADRDGLWVRVSLLGAVTFFYRYRFNGKQDKMTIGKYPQMSLKDARDELLKWSSVLEKGQNPKYQKVIIASEKNNIGSFEEVFRDWFDVICKQRVSAHQIMRTFELHVFPYVGKYPINDLTVHMWLDLLDQLSKKYSEITKRVISNGRQCYSWAVKRRIATSNPLTDLTGKDFGIQKGVGDRTLSADEIELFWWACEQSRVSFRNEMMLKLCLFFGCRVSELRLSKVCDFDLVEKLWTVPAENHKTGGKTKKPLVRPLIDDVIPVIKKLVDLSVGDYLFSNGKEPQLPSAHLKLPINLLIFIKKHKKKTLHHFSIHDLRRTARTNFSELTQPHVAEVMLGHKLPGVWGVYDKYNYIDEMREAYQSWWRKLMVITKAAQ